jgi:hypothetical protein
LANKTSSIAIILENQPEGMFLPAAYSMGYYFTQSLPWGSFQNDTLARPAGNFHSHGVGSFALFLLMIPCESHTYSSILWVFKLLVD